MKTLEEPPAHAIFLLATTEIHKIPDTILSRVIRFDLTKIGETDMRGLLQKICTQEAIKYEEEALNMIIHRSRGSLRDSLTMLEKCIIEKTLKTENVEHALHLVNHTFLRKTFDALRSGEGSAIQDIVNTLEDESTDIRQFSAQMTEWIVDHIGEAFEEKAFGIYREIFDLFTQIFVQSKLVAVPMDILRMALYEKIKTGTLKNTPKASKPPEVPKEESPKTPEKLELPPVTHILQEPEKELPEPRHEITSPSHEIPTVSGSTEDKFSAEKFLGKIQELGVKSTLLPLLRTASIEQKGNTITITTTSFGKGRCEEQSTYIILAQAASSFGAEISIITHGNTTPEEVQTDSVDIARAIFE